MQFEKYFRRGDGSLVVTGYASTAAIDSDGESISTDAMREALPDYLRWSNVREMQGFSIAGETLARGCA